MLLLSDDVDVVDVGFMNEAVMVVMVLQAAVGVVEAGRRLLSLLMSEMTAASVTAVPAVDTVEVLSGSTCQCHENLSSSIQLTEVTLSQSLQPQNC